MTKLAMIDGFSMSLCGLMINTFVKNNVPFYFEVFQKVTLFKKNINN